MNPITFDMPYEVDRNRLTTFLRPIVAIPWIIWVVLYGIVAALVALIAWFALLFTKRYPDALYGFVAGYLQVSTQAGAFLMLATDEWPPFTPSAGREYPVRLEVGASQVEYRRSRTFFKILTAIPQQLILGGLNNVLAAASVITWVRVLFTGRQSVTMQDAMRMSLAYTARANGFLLLLTEVHPRLLDLPPQQVPADAPALPGPGQMQQSGTPVAPPHEPPAPPAPLS